MNRWPFVLGIHRRTGPPMRLLLLLLLITACAQRATTWDLIRERGVIRIGLDPTFAPFEVADENGLWGFDVDLAMALAADLEMQVEFVHFGYDGLYDALLSEQVDALISALVISPEKTRDFAYSDAYFDAGQSLFYPATSRRFDSQPQPGSVIAAEIGSEGHLRATELGRQIDDLQVRLFNSGEEALGAVMQGQVDAAIVDQITGRLFMSENPFKLRQASENLTSEPYAVVVRRADEILLDQINNSLDQIRKDGELVQIYEKWFGE